MKKLKKSAQGAAVGGDPAVKPGGAKAAAPEVRRGPPRTEKPAAAPSAPSAPAPESATQAILTELAALRRMLERMSAPPSSDDAALESGVDSMRRLLTELLESRLDPVIAEIAAIRTLAASEAEGKSGSVVDRLDLLLNDLGAVRFEAQRLDYYDPLIHQVLEERRDAVAPDRVILETVVPGYRTQRGRVVAKAGVAINRRA